METLISILLMYKMKIPRDLSAMQLVPGNLLLPNFPAEFSRNIFFITLQIILLLTITFAQMVVLNLFCSLR